LSTKKKRQTPVKHRKKPEQYALSILGQFHCDLVRYDFNVPLDLFKTKAFSKETDLKVGDHWAAVLPSDDARSGYHVHFTGQLDKEHAHLRVEFFDHAIKRKSTHPPPSSESVFEFLGSFIREPTARATILARFEKPDSSWRSRFNLPFKVTMAGAEVVIDGVSLVLPKNRFNAASGWLTKINDAVIVSVALTRSIEFSSFNLADEVATLNESIKMFVEQTV
jgi:hypothetical protein